MDKKLYSFVVDSEFNKHPVLLFEHSDDVAITRFIKHYLGTALPYKKTGSLIKVSDKFSFFVDSHVIAEDFSDIIELN